MARPVAPTCSELRQLLPAAVAATVQAAALIGRARGRVAATDIERKGVGDFVTAVDLRAQRLLRRLLRGALPTAGFLGEEGDSEHLDRDLVWVVDPIDGTSNFANGLPHHAVAVALLWRRLPVLAVLACEPEGVLYTAIRGDGARRAGRRIRIPAGRSDDGAIFGCQWHRGQQDLVFLAKLQTTGARIRTFGCTVVQLTDVAMGRLHANVQQQGRIWDIAAAGLVVEEAGGRFTDWAGKPVFPFGELECGHLGTIAAPRTVHRRIVKMLA
ncbi:MAG: inositol monophosphatase [Planctomycetes bacterium]|nr:inositol monophosphatase [Planctomycetota bacterium]